MKRLRHLAISVMALAATTMLGLGVTTVQALGMGDGNAKIMADADKTRARTMLTATTSEVGKVPVGAEIIQIADARLMTADVNAEHGLSSKFTVAGLTIAEPTRAIAITSTCTGQPSAFATTS